MAHTLVIFGASGDLTQRKLIPALFRLHIKGRLPAETRIVGCSRSEFSDDRWRDSLGETTAKFVGEEFQAKAWNDFASRVYYQTLDIGQATDFAALASRLSQLDGGEDVARVYYLSTLPRLYAQAAAQLGSSGLAAGNAPRRIVIEKPFGVDRDSARRLNEDLHRVFDEKDVYRIDHYLGKETVQNMLVLRFANSIFEPLWNRNYIDHVQITVAEHVRVGSRGAYYDGSGILRDMFQNHLLQLMTITAMEAPPRFEADMVRDEKVKVLQAVRPLEGDEFTERTLRFAYEVLGRG